MGQYRLPKWKTIKYIEEGENTSTNGWIGCLAGWLLACLFECLGGQVSSCLSPPAQSDTAIGTNVITIHLAIIYHQLPAVLYITVINPLIEKDPLPQCLV
jgi:hypothetical protein